MKVLLLSTTSRMSRAWLAEALEPLADRDLDLALAVLRRPAEPLPVRRCLVLGASLRPRRQVVEARTQGGPRPAPAGRRRKMLRKLDRRLLKVAPDKYGADNSLLFAAGAIWSPQLREEFRGADLVICLDLATTWAGWHLARRIEGPEVVFSVAGAVRKLAELEAAA
ncbi:hypothetical protein GUY44_11150 [Pimelobacter simplex]|uniref:Uncharacterized protein n=1 Tax=Nocardioides simplex TaxID=2045 RepID=A0A0A1DHG4_NOCSI|nr:hypothetical protein [Pimelobacter simplex]AIY16032.1 hypothetical protein KR76_03340 [Pimelobacter simplex]MCG8151036.1 hypothetical protein [Pimelobacter simplex]GEB12332.1 hypothetical protein NSI01_06470 [Pimelobacter simplex]SFM96426.1 hypothetical protein SAMN05421671_4399 [Pimelobacter simplex]